MIVMKFGGTSVQDAKAIDRVAQIVQGRLADLENSLTQIKLDPVENAPLLAPLLDIPLPPDRVPASLLDPGSELALDRALSQVD